MFFVTVRCLTKKTCPFLRKFIKPFVDLLTLHTVPMINYVHDFMILYYHI